MGRAVCRQRVRTGHPARARPQVPGVVLHPSAPQCTPVHSSTPQCTPAHPGAPQPLCAPTPAALPGKQPKPPGGVDCQAPVAGDGGDRGCSSRGERPALAQQRPLPSFLSFFLRGSLVSPSKDHALSTATTILTWTNFLRIATLQMHALLIKSQTPLFHRFV